ncbi:DUF934 domain-containing protein [Vineibacter terrae]|uniref:DUF934 domain-containing protein n=1 Tax=Vineibacter terrae TaxID=2586908 RepID=UPI002E343242|nr:DUF934 domain-containing protein [Vineibacter terrae]HEX2885931.1 DUF934 domain-containing protein [Vineibacter terrae]
MPLLKGGALIDDPWQRLADDTALPADGAVIVSFARWRAEREALLARSAPLGVLLKNTDPVDVLAADIAHLQLIALEFPKFSDGRAYSQARLLRERHRFGGELRATGQVLPDQLHHMRRCGFDAFEVAKGDPVTAWRRAVHTFSAVYQPTGDGRAPVSALRRRLLAAAAD